MKKNGTYYIKFYSLVLLVLVVVGYSGFQAQKILRGPVINLSSPLNGATYTTPLIEIKGVAKNTSVLRLNDRPLYTDKLGNFKDSLLLLPGYNIIKLQAEDKFGAHVERKIEIIYKEL
ncbi:MAG: hypothetical protein NTV02_01120 [Candidatus Zambryskibacteria bacterium]|nr:hypothetical protein [Candidatus Zambryskibacteria bacterium]